MKDLIEKQSLLERKKLLDRLRKNAKPVKKETNIIPIVNRQQSLLVSWSQQRLWFIAQLSGQASRAYHVPVSLGLSGSLDLESLERTLDGLVERHEVLRTTFAQNEAGEPIQVIHQNCAFALTHINLSDLNKTEQNERLAEQYKLESEALFDLETGPLIRGRLIYLGLSEKDEPQYILLVTMHHIVSDVWSIGIFTREISSLYKAYLHGSPNPLKPLPIQYADYAHWQRSVLVNESLNQEVAYWRGQLNDVPELLSLPWDRPRPKQQDFCGGSIDIHLSVELTNKLNTLAKSKGMTLYMVLLSAWGVLLSRLSGQETVVIGTPVANRPRSELEGLIGFFVNTLAVRLDVVATTVLSSYLDDVKGRMLAAYDHQNVPFEQIVEAIQPVRSLSHNALFQAMFSYENTSNEDDLELPGVSLSPNVDQGDTLLNGAKKEEQAQFDLSLSLREVEAENGRSIVGGLGYASALFDEVTITRWAGYFETLLESFVNESKQEQVLGVLPVLAKAERDQLLYEFNDTKVGYPQDKCIHELIEMQARLNPDAIALVYEDQTFSYQELNKKSNQLAHFLITQGVVPDTLVGICVERSLDMVVGLLGILKAGAAYVPLDPNYPKDRLRYMLEDSDVKILLTQQSLLEQLPITHQQAFCLDTKAVYANQVHTDIDVQSLGLEPNHLAYVIYTSGTTGNPKGVMIRHANAVAFLFWSKDVYSERVLSRVLASTSMCFDLSVFEFFAPLSSGGCVVLVKDILGLSSDGMSVTQPTLINTVPSAIQSLLDMELIPETVKTINLAGELLKQDLVDRLYEKGIDDVYDLYGPSEATTYASYIRRTYKGTPSIGKPISNTQVYIVDHAGRPSPLNVEGEIYVGGAGIARGYLNRPELTSKKFIPNPFSEDPEARLYKTGDLGSWNTDGTLNYLGRNDDQVKIRGFRIELGEIESRLQSQENVQSALVMAYGEDGQKQLVAYLIPELSAKNTSVNDLEDALNVELIRSSLKASLPEYMIPSEMIVLDEFPLTPNGKIDRKALPAPDGSGLSRKAFEAPEGELEQSLAEIWQDLLKIKKVGRHDNFFDLGGHSLLAVQLVSRIEQGLSKTLSLKSLFDQPVLLDMANELAKGDVHQHRAIMRVERDQPLPVSWSQQRLWFIAQLDAQASRAYHISASLRLSGTLNLEALERTLNTLLERHEVLRTSFAQNEAGEPIQVIHQDCVFALTHVDLSGLNKVERNERLAEQQEAEAGTLFDLETGPLIRGRLIELGVSDKGEPEYILLATMHHIVSDGWSMGIFTREISALYEAFSQGQVNPLEPLQIQYADYAHWQRSVLVDDALNQQLNYWLDQLSGAPELLSLPWDRPRPNQQDYRGGSVDIRLNVELTSKLNTLAKAKGMTLYMVLLSAWGVLLSRLSGQETVVIGTPVANRPRSELEGLIGFFVNTLAIRLDVNATGNVSSYLDDVKGRTLGAYGHQDVPFEQVVEAIQPSRNLGHSALFQAMFAYENTPEAGTFELSGLSLPSNAEQSDTQDGEQSQFDLSLSLQEVLSQEGYVISGELNYASALFDELTIVRWVGHFKSLLESLSKLENLTNESKLDQALGSLPMLIKAERDQLLYEFNNTQVDYPQDKCIHELFEAQVDLNPNAIALKYEEQTLSYQELNKKSNQLAHYLIAQGVVPDTLVGICVERSLDMVVGLLGILKAGAAYVPLDPSYPKDRLSYMLEDSDVKILLTQQSLLEQLPITYQQAICLDAEAVYANQVHTNIDVQSLGLEPNHLAYVIYTSGSTGLPKGVMICHQGIVNKLLFNYGEVSLSSCDRALQKASIAFDVSTLEIFEPLLHGAQIIICSEVTQKDLISLKNLVCLQKITVLDFTPSLLQAFLGNNEGDLYPNIRRITCGGEALSLSTVRDCLKQFPNSKLINSYGPTETSIDSTYYACNFIEGGSVPVGFPINNTQVYILDEQQRLVPLGVSGELCIGGAGLARGYLNRPELTAEKFIANPYYDETNRNSSKRLYRTGDVGCWNSDGTLSYLGRNDHQVKIRGFRIELGEIESQLQSQDCIHEALVIPYGEGSATQIVAFITSTNKQEKDDTPIGPDVNNIRSSLRSSLPEYMMPNEIVVLDAFPLTTNGKVDRKALPAPDGSGLSRKAFEAPEGELEQSLADIWQNLLKVKKVGRQDNFFDLGGHSLLVMQLMEQLRRRGWEMSVQSVFTSPELAALAVAIKSTYVTGYEAPVNLIMPETEQITPELLPLFGLQGEKSEINTNDIARIVKSVPGGVQNIQDIYPLAPLQEGILFHHRLAEDGLYETPYLFCVDSQSQCDAFVRAIQSVIDRHDILRTAILWEGLSLPVQVVYRSAALQIESVTLIPDQDEREQVNLLLDKLSIDVERAPLMRLQLAKSKDGDCWYVLIQHHHLVTDHVSGDIIQEEVHAYLRGEEASLPNPMPYRNFIAHMLTQTSHHDAQTYFTGQLGDIVEISAPFGLLNVHDDGRNVVEICRGLSPELSRQIRMVCKQKKISSATFFHMVWGLVVSACSGQKDVVFGTMMLGRLQGAEGSDRIIGMFLNMLPLRLTVGADMSVEKYLHQTHARVLGLLPYEQYPLVQAQQCSGLPGNTPLFTSILNYRHSEEEKASSEEGGLDFGIESLGGEERTNYPFSLSVDDLGEGFDVTAQIDRSVSAERILGYVIQGLTSLVEALTTSPTQRLSALTILPDIERDQLLYELNDTKVGYPQDKCIHELIEMQARLNPDAIALVYEDQTFSYQELNKKSNQLAHFLIAQGVVPDTLVGICVERSLDMVVGLLGILKAGAAYVPLDPSYPKDRLRYMLEDSDVKILLTQQSLLEQLPITHQQAFCLDTEAVYANQVHTDIDVQSLGLEPNHLAYVIYTSGTTGNPKGVMIRHANAVAFLFWSKDVYSERVLSRVLASTSMCFDLSVFEFFAPLSSGGCVVLVKDILGLSSDGMSVTQPTLINTVPSAIQSLLDMELIPETVKTINLAGELLKQDLVDRLYEKGIDDVYDLYGPSEATTYASYIRRTYKGTPSIGKPISNTQVYIVDHAGRPSPLNIEGEIYVGGAGIARGYLNRPELTSKKFIPNPFSEDPESRLYKTGDLGSWNIDGTLKYLGRNDDQVKIRGFRIELGEIESRLQSQENVQDALAMAYGEDGQKQLVAYLIPELSAKNTSVNDLEDALNVELIRSSLKASLPEYMIPSEMIVLDELPLTPNGKIDRKALPAPDGSGLSKKAFEAPEGELEQSLADIWQDLLKIKKVGRRDNFFDLGGHSLLAAQLINEIKKRLGISIQILDVFQEPFLNELSKKLIDKQLKEYTDIDILLASDDLENLSAEQLKQLLLEE